MKNVIEEIKFQYERFKRWFIEIKYNMSGVNRSFYCQSDIECNRQCKIQCDHCKEYYKPLE